MLRFILPALAAVVFLVPGVNADDAKKAKKKGLDTNAAFEKADANKDNKLSPAEFAVALTELKHKKAGEQPKNAAKAGKKAAALFVKLDTDKNGSLSREEFAKLPEVMKEMKKK
jgi:hypothetical protein